MDKLLVVPYDSSMLQECIDLYQDVFSKEPWLENSNRDDVERLFLNFMDGNKFIGMWANLMTRLLLFQLAFLSLG